jgi:hypothetical protein
MLLLISFCTKPNTPDPSNSVTDEHDKAGGRHRGIWRENSPNICTSPSEACKNVCVSTPSSVIETSAKDWTGYRQTTRARTLGNCW